MVSEQILAAAAPVAFNYYGESVAVNADGSVIVVGAIRAVGAAVPRGRAYVYSGPGLTTETILVPSDSADFDRFGQSVAVSDDGSIIAVGAWTANGTGTERGRVYVYSGAGWATEQIIDSPSPADFEAFGFALSLSAAGDVLLVGAHDVAGGTGKAYVLGGVAFGTATTLTASDGAAGDTFGYAVALSRDGTVALVCAPNHDNGGGDFGKGYVYTGGGWPEADTLIPPGGIDGAQYAVAAALNEGGSVAAIGAMRYPDGPLAAGAVFVYSGVGYATLDLVQPSDPIDFSDFGRTVSLNAAGDVLAVGAPFWFNGAITPGKGYRYSGAGYASEAGLLASDGTDFAAFGQWVALNPSASRTVIGSPFWSDGVDLVGQAYVYSEVAGAARRQRTLTGAGT